MPTNSNLWGSDDEQDFLQPKKSKPVKEKSKNTTLFDSDEDKELELDLLRMKEAFKTKIHAVAVKTSTTVKDDKTKSKKPSLFDYEDESPIRVATKPPTSIKKSASGLFDEEDDEEDELFLSNTAKSKPSSSKETKPDFETLYKTEKSKRIELEQLVESLKREVSDLRKAAGHPDMEDPVETPVVASAVASGQPSEEWERLALEEKERRQRARAMKSKARPVSKRLTSATAAVGAAGSAGSSTGIAEKPAADAAPTETSSSAPSSVPKLSPLPTWDESDSESEQPSKSTTVETSSTKVEDTDKEATDAAAPAVTDEKSSHWEALAEQEKERKAQARRSRAVVRGGAKPKSLAAAVHSTSSTAANSVANSRSVSPLPGRSGGVVPTAASTVNATTSTTTVTHDNSDLKRFDSSGEDSGWEDSNAESEADVSAAALQKQGKESDNRPSGSTSSSNKGASSSSTTTGVSEEVESDLDTRLIDWVRSCRNNIKKLLQTVHTVYHGPLPDLQSMWNEDNGDDDGAIIRKAYLKVVRVCHPDKQTHLDPQSLEFLEASRVFTIISDSYNKYKASNG